MPTIGIFADDLCKDLAMPYSEVDTFVKEKAEKEFNAICFRYGLELDEITCQWEMIAKEKSEQEANRIYEEALAKDPQKAADLKRTQWKIDIPANRYDLLCMEGLTQALKTFNTGEIIKYRLVTPDRPVKCLTKKEVAQVRPYLVMAVLRDIKFTDVSFQSFIDLQDKLHQNIGRRRQLVSMGTHDLDTLEGPFSYEALAPESINFIPLKDPVSVEHDGQKSYEAKTLLTGYLKGLDPTNPEGRGHPQLRAYVPLIYDAPIYPVIYDKNRRVCSLPPIINSWHSRIKKTTKNVLLDVTGLDYTKCNIVLDTLCAMFSEHCDERFTVERVEMTIEEDFPSEIPFVKPGQVKLYPTMEEKEFIASCSNLKDTLALHHLSNEDVQKLLLKMNLCVELDVSDTDRLRVMAPCTRSDIMHEVDIVEDLAIAYGYNNLKTVSPQLSTEIKDQKINRLTDMLRQEFAGAGFNECLNFALCSKEDCFDWFNNRTWDMSLLEGEGVPVHQYEPRLPPVLLSNPKAKEYNMVRTSLVNGLLKTMNYNKKNALPIRLFEVSDVVVQDKRRETGARNQRRAAALICGQQSNFEIIHGLLDHIMYKLNCRSDVEVEEEKLEWKGRTYRLEPANDSEFIPGMCGHIYVGDLRVGVAGVLRPDVLNPPTKPVDYSGPRNAPWAITAPASILELNIEPFLQWLEES